jgi:glutaconate CoA-transferase subunit B
MKTDAPYSTNELMTVTASRLLKDGQNVVVGLGLPQIATLLAKRTHAPNLTIIYEIGVINPETVDPGVGIADPRYWYRADYYTGFIGTLGRILQKGGVDVGFLGGLQIDRYGNINSTQTNNDDGSFRHFTGSGGAADIASCSKKIYCIVKHEKRKIVDEVDYLTSVGYFKGKDSREKEGLSPCAEIKVISNLCVFSFDADKTIKVESIHPGVTPEEVIENTGTKLKIAAGTKTTEEPSKEDIHILRTYIDPDRKYI